MSEKISNCNEELKTIQKIKKLNNIYAVGERSFGNAHHEFLVVGANDNKPITTIKMQHGPRNNKNSTNGLVTSDLLEIARFQLKEFQTSDFATDYNAKAIEHIEIALMYMNKRVEDRIERDVLGTLNL